jgi:hypothetical protein
VTPESVEQEIHALEEQRDHALLLADSETLAHLLGETGSSTPTGAVGATAKQVISRA